MKVSNIDASIERSNQFKNALIECGLSVNKNWFFNIRKNSIEVSLTENESFKRVFGSTIDIYNSFTFKSEETIVKLSSGSMGSFDLSCTASVEKYLLMAEFVKNFSILEKLTKQFCIKADEYNKLHF
tara:strand:+ start:124 stop:504 length:381 start_codon:yes stop_codon:yes gene_type:complete